MSRHHKILAVITLAVSLPTLIGCIIDPNQSGSTAGNNYQSNPGGTSYNADPAASARADYDRGCADARSGAYDRSGHAGQAYEGGWNDCRNGGGNQGGAQHHGGLEAAKKACLFQFGRSGYVETVSPLKPGFWEIIVTERSGRKVACTADAQGTVSDWVEM